MSRKTSLTFVLILVKILQRNGPASRWLLQIVQPVVKNLGMLGPRLSKMRYIFMRLQSSFPVTGARERII